jgi:hypothetical protein
MHMGDDGARALLRSAEGLPALETLDVSNCGLYAPVLRELAAGLPRLRELRARRNWIHPHEEDEEDAAASASGAHTLLGALHAAWRPHARTTRLHRPPAVRG